MNARPCTACGAIRRLARVSLDGHPSRARRWLGALLGLSLLPGAALQSAETRRLQPTTIFSAKDIPGGGGLHLPSLLVMKSGTVIAVCQMRKTSPGDWGHDTDLVLRRSKDSGLTWEPMQVVFTEPGVNAVNGPILEIRSTGTLLMPFTKVPASGTSLTDWVHSQASIGGSVWTMTSRDEGKTWSTPVESKPTGKPGWVAWSNNSSHGLELPDGRLVIPGMTQRIEPDARDSRATQYSACLLLSDDRGRSWRIGAITPFYGTDEVALALCSDGSLLASVRINNRRPVDLVRLLVRSRDRGESFAESELKDHISLTRCHAGMVAATDQAMGTRRSVLVHTGPQGGGGTITQPVERSRLAIRLSYDDGRSWPVSQVVTDPLKDTEYSDVGITANGTILCIYGANTFSKTDSSMELIRVSLRSVELDSFPFFR